MPEGGGVYRALFENITFDANLLADNGILEIGAADSTFRDVSVLNAAHAGIRCALFQTTPTLSAVTATVPGGSPAGVTVSLLDPNFLGLMGAQVAGTYPVRLQVQTPGARDVAQLKLSLDGGATFQTFLQPISVRSNIAVDGGTGNATAITGIQAQFPPGPYFAGDHWDFTATTTNGDISPVAPNFEIRYDNIVLVGCGWAYSTAAVSGRLGGNLTVLGASSITLTAGSLFAVGTGAVDFTTMRMAGASRAALWVNVAGGKSFQVIGALSPTVLALTPDTAPTAAQAGSGLDFTIGTGGGFYEDGLTETGDQFILGGHTDLVSVGWSFGAQFGAHMVSHEFTNCGLFACMFGGSISNGSTRNVIDSVQMNSQTHGGMYFAPSSSGSWIEPHHQNISSDGRGSGWILTIQGSVYPVDIGGTVSNLALNTLTLTPGLPFTFVTGAETIPVPDLTQPAGHASYVRFTATSALLLTGSPTIAVPPINGLVLVLHNVGTNPVTFQASGGFQYSGSGMELDMPRVTVGSLEIITLISSGTQWFQWGGVSHIYRGPFAASSSSGNFGSEQVTTTDATPTTIYSLLVGSGFGFDAIAFEFDLIANTAGGAARASWLRVSASLDNAGVIDGAPDLGVARGSNGGNPPAGWTWSITSPAASRVNIQVTGAAATTIDWGIKVRMITGSGR